MAKDPFWTSNENHAWQSPCVSDAHALDDVFLRHMCRKTCDMKLKEDSSPSTGPFEYRKARNEVKSACGREVGDHCLSRNTSLMLKDVCLPSSTALAEQAPSNNSPGDSKCESEINRNRSSSSSTSGVEEVALSDNHRRKCRFAPAELIVKDRSSEPQEGISTCGVKSEDAIQNVASSGSMHGLPISVSEGHSASLRNISMCCNVIPTRLSNCPREPVESSPAFTGGSSQDAKESKSATYLLENWSSERECFIWSHCKSEIIWIFLSFNVLLALIGEAYWITGYNALLLVFPWIATLIFASLLLSALLLDYVRSRTLCFCASPLLFLLAFLSWFIPNCFFNSDVEAQSGFLAVMGLLISISLPWLLSAAPIMAWQFALFLSLIIPFLTATMFFLRPTEIKLSMDLWAIIPIIVLLASSNVLLWHLRSVKSLRVLHLIDSWACAFRESKEHEEQARVVLEERERDNADRISKMRQFISYIFHEIRVPFNAVMLGIGHLLASDITEEQHDILNMMDFSSSLMIRILNDVLDMGKIEAGKLHLEKQPFNMGEMVNSLVWAFKDTMDSKGVEFSLCIDPNTKQLLSSYDLLGDKHRVRQVLANYLSNATKFTPRGGKVTLKIVCTGTYTVDSFSGDGILAEELESFTRKLGLSKSGKSLLVKTTDKVASITACVEDTGIGISKEDQALLFEPYIQISAGSSQGGGGTGLGLSFAKRIIDLAGGKIGVFSEVGKGSVFEFTMPFQLVEYVKDKDGEEMQKSSEDVRNKYPVFRSSPASSPSTKSKVLVVEDNILNRKIIKKLLESFNLDSDDAENGKEAVDLVLEGRSYDMILIDKEMPVMDGHEATRQLRAIGVKAPIIGLTGNALNSDRNEFIAAGVDDFFTKPISRHQLVKLLEAYGLIPKTKERLHVPRSMLQELGSV